MFCTYLGIRTLAFSHSAKPLSRGRRAFIFVPCYTNVLLFCSLQRSKKSAICAPAIRGVSTDRGQGPRQGPMGAGYQQGSSHTCGRASLFKQRRSHTSHHPWLRPHGHAHKRCQHLWFADGKSPKKNWAQFFKILPNVKVDSGRKGKLICSCLRRDR